MMGKEREESQRAVIPLATRGLLQINGYPAGLCMTADWDRNFQHNQGAFCHVSLAPHHDHRTSTINPDLNYLAVRGDFLFLISDSCHNYLSIGFSRAKTGSVKFPGAHKHG